MSQNDTEKPKNNELNTKNISNETPLTDKEILETLKQAHKTILAQKDDLLKRKISQNIEHKLEVLKTKADSSKILPERITRK